MIDDPTARMFEGFAEAFNHVGDVMNAAATASRENHRPVSADYAEGLRDMAWLARDHALEVAVTPADQRQLIASNPVVLTPSDVGETVRGQPLEATP